MVYPRLGNVFFIGLIFLLMCLIAILSSLYHVWFLICFVGVFFFIALLAFSIKKPGTMLKFLTLIMLASLFLFPSFTFNSIGLRFEDLISPMLLLLVFIAAFKDYNKNLYTPVNKWVIFFVFYSLSITILNIGINHLSSMYVFYSLKEAQYFIYFFAFVYLAKTQNIKTPFIKFFVTVSLLTMGWGVYQLIFDTTAGYYGIGVMSETSSSQSGGVFLIISIFSLYLINRPVGNLKRFLSFTMFLISFGLTFATVSRTAILAVTLVYITYLCFALFRVSAKRVIIWLYVFLLFSPVIFFSLRGTLDTIFDRLQRLDGGTLGRTQKWEWLLSYGDTQSFIFGEGRGFVQTIIGGFTLGADSQYVRNILEVGAIGSFLFFLITLYIMYFAFKNLKRAYGESLFLILITVGFLIMSVTHEVFLVTIQASLYWSLVGCFVGMIMNIKENYPSKKKV